MHAVKLFQDINRVWFNALLNSQPFHMANLFAQRFLCRWIFRREDAGTVNVNAIAQRNRISKRKDKIGVFGSLALGTVL